MKRIPKKIMIGAARLIAVLPLSAFALAATGIWALEPWLRPLTLVRVDDPWLLAAAITGWAAAAFAWPGKCRRSWWWRAGVATVLCLAGMIAAPTQAGKVAVRMLMRSWEIHYAFHDEPPEWIDHDPWTKHFSERWFYLGKETPEWEMHGENAIGGTMSSTQYHPRFTPYDHLIETSRWSFRKTYIMKVMRDEKAVVLATRDWHRLFPAIVGQDVTLACRNELIDLLHAISGDASAAPASRQAATFWMGLIVLTDAPEFERWQQPVRDAMLASDDPPMSHTGDVWMRVLDALLAFDADPAASAEILTKDGVLLRRAVRERVRGMEAHVHAIMHEIDRLDNAGHPRAATALWLDLKHIARDSKDDALPTWLAEKMIHWLTGSPDEVSVRFGAPDRSTRGAGEFVVPLSRGQQDQLHRHVDGVLGTAAGLPYLTKPRIRFTSELPNEIGQALLIGNFLDEDRRTDVARRVGSLFAGHIASIHADETESALGLSQLFEALMAIWEDLEIDARVSLIDDLQKTTRREGGRWLIRTSAFIAQLDAASPSPVMREGDRLAAILSAGGQIGLWPGSWSWWSREQVAEPPPFTSAAVEEFADALMQARDPNASASAPGDDDYSWNLAMKKLRLRPSRFHESTADSPDLIRFLLIHSRFIGHDPPMRDWPLLFNSCPEIRYLACEMPDAEIWGPLMETPEAARSTLALLSAGRPHDLGGWLGSMRHHPPSEEIRRIIWDHFRKSAESDSRKNRIAAWHVLVHTSDLMEPVERLATRMAFLDFFQRERPSLGEWSSIMMLDKDPHRDLPWRYAIWETHHRGEWIDWEEDALSARLSWSSQIHHELSMLPHDWNIKPDGGLFMHLNTAIDVNKATPWDIYLRDCSIDNAVPSGMWRQPPPQLPFPPTAWQRARKLHLKRPDLHFPDHPAFRPSITTFTVNR